MRRYDRIKAVVSLDAIAHNFGEMKKNIAKGTKIIAVIKADGYGHGAEAIARLIHGYSYIWGFAVATAEEALQLRAFGVTKPILILGIVFEEYFPDMVEQEIRLTVSEYSMAEKLSEEAVRQGKTVHIHIGLDTGMSRIGFSDTTESVQEIKKITELSNVEVEGLFTHFARADETDISPAEKQLERYVTFERLLQSTGKTFYTMITQGVGAIINIIFDPILIFGLIGFPKMGVAGAAAATVLGQIVACILAIILNHFKNHEVRLNFKGFRPNGKIIKTIYAVGVPSIIMASISSVMTFGMNKILIAFTSTATAVFGVYFKLQSFVFMPVFGLNNGMVPIVAYNFGAKRADRITKTVKLSIIYAVGIMLIGFALFMLIPESLLKIFNASDNMLSIGVPALRIISFNFIFAGFAVICSSLFQALGHGMLSLLISVLRQLVVLLPLAFILAQFGELNNVWLAFPISEIVSFAVCIIFMRYAYRKEIKPLKENQ